MSIEKAVSSAASSYRQTQVQLSFAVVLPTLVYPLAYYVVPGSFTFPITIPPTFVFAIPINVDSWGFEYSVTGDTNATTFAGIQVYDNYDANTGLVSGLSTTLAMKYAPRVADFEFSKGIALRPYAGKYLTFLFAHYSVNPVSVMAVSISGLLDVLLSAETTLAQVRQALYG